VFPPVVETALIISTTSSPSFLFLPSGFFGAARVLATSHQGITKFPITSLSGNQEEENHRHACNLLSFPPPLFFSPLFSGALLFDDVGRRTGVHEDQSARAGKIDVIGVCLRCGDDQRRARHGWTFSTPFSPFFLPSLDFRPGSYGTEFNGDGANRCGHGNEWFRMPLFVWLPPSSPFFPPSLPSDGGNGTSIGMGSSIRRWAETQYGSDFFPFSFFPPIMQAIFFTISEFARKRLFVPSLFSLSFFFSPLCSYGQRTYEAVEFSLIPLYRR